MSRSNLLSNNGISELSVLNCDLINTRNVIQINEYKDFPKDINGVINLEDNITYEITGFIDLQGRRIQCGSNNVIIGHSSENCKLSSTGLNEAIISSNKTCVFRHFTFLNNEIALNILGDGTTALDWYGINFENVKTIGLIDNIANFIFKTGAFLNSGGLVFGTKADTVSFSDCLFLCNDNNTSITIDCNITRRFRIILSSMITFSGSVALNTINATIPVESYILENVNFSGSGVYLSGFDKNDVETLFLLCNNIDNTFVNGQVYMNDNVTPTVISTTTDFFKISGATTGSENGQKTTLTDNRITINAGIQRKYFINCSLSFSSGSNNQCSFGFFDSTLGGIRPPSINNTTANSGGRAENISMSCIISAVSGDYFEVWCKNKTSTTNITISDLNMTITQL